MAKLKLFLDTNIIIDLLADRQPYSNAAYEIFKKAKLNKWSLFTSSNSIITTFYIVNRNLGSKETNRAIETILNRLQIQDLNNKDFLVAIKSKTIDLEDSCQIVCANKIPNLDYIITRDKKGFRHSSIAVINSDELINI